MRALPLLVTVLTAIAAASIPVAAADPAADPAADRATADRAAAARALVDRWLAAQNQGRFDDYAALYGDGFHGTKRVGATTRAMDRAAWLEDRKAMFRAPMTVAADELSITPGDGDTIVVALTQTWRQGDFADTGHKRITLDAAAAHVIGEDMLDSRVLLTEGACLAAFYPGSSWARRVTGRDDLDRQVLAVTLVDLGTTTVCQVDVQDPRKVVSTIAPFTFQKRWTAGAHVDLDYDVAHGEEGHEQTGSIGTTEAALADAGRTIDVARVTDDLAPMFSDHEETHTLYRVTPAALVEVFTYASTSLGGEDGNADECTMMITPRVRRGWHDLSVECVHSHARYPGSPTDHDWRRSKTTRYHWNGNAYVDK